MIKRLKVIINNIYY